MKLQLDTLSKVIVIEEEVSFKELMDTLEKIFPKGEWKEYTLKPEIIVRWSNPIVIPQQPYSPYRQPWFTYNTNNSDNYKIADGVFDIETN